MKTIDTLVEDIYNLFETGVDVDDKTADELGKAIAETVKDRMAAYKHDREPYLRLSNIGRKTRQLYYELNGYKKEELRPSTKIKFLYGDILEHLLLFFAKNAGHTVTGEQDSVSVAGVKGSRDCLIDGVTVDVKSASTYSFNKFRDDKLRDNDPFGYIAQISAYTAGDSTAPQDQAAFLVIDKTLGNICLHKVEELDFINVEGRIEEVKESLSKDVPPARCYEPEPDGKSGNMKLGVGCSYCSFKEECWKDSNGGKGLQVYKYSNGVKFLTNVSKEPRVPKVEDDESWDD